MIKRSIALLLGVVVLATSCPEVVTAAETVLAQTQEEAEHIQVEETEPTEQGEIGSVKASATEEVSEEEDGTEERTTEEIIPEEETVMEEETTRENITTEETSVEEALTTEDEIMTEEESVVEEETTTEEETTMEEVVLTEEDWVDLQASTVTYVSLDISSDYTVKSNLIITGDVTVNSGTLDLNGYTVTVKGDVKLNKGMLYMNGGKMNVQGDFMLGVKGSAGRLRMDQEADMLTVEGDFTANSSGYSPLQAGTISLKGDFAQYGTDSLAEKSCFECEKEHKVVFCGKQEQRIYFDSSCSRFNFVEFTHKNIFLDSGISDFTLCGASNQYLNVPEELRIYGVMNLNGKTLTILSDVKLKRGRVYFNKGTLNVKGDLCLDFEAAGSIDDDGELYMENDADTLNVEGNLTVCGVWSKLTAGTITLTGDFAQYGTGDSRFRGYCEYNFFASGTHRVVFCGKEQQSIYFESLISTFQYVKFENKNIEIKSTINRLELDADAELYLKVPEDGLRIKSKLNLNGHTLTIHNDLNVMEGKILLNEGTLEVEGNFSLGTKAQLDAGKASKAYLVMNQEADTLIVKGDFVTCSNRRSSTDGDLVNILTNGTLRLSGDFYQYGTTSAEDSQKIANKADYCNFEACENHKIVFCGDKVQKIYFDSTYSKFNIIKFENNRIALQSEIRGFRLYEDVDLYLQTAEEIGLAITGNINLNGKKLTIHNDLNLTDGRFNFNGGTLHVEGNFYMGTEEQVEAGKTLYGKLVMQNEEDLLEVDGDIIIYGGSSGELMAGTIRLKGDFLLYGDTDEITYPIVRTEKQHKIVFCGNKKQNIYFASTRSGFNLVEFENKNIEIQSMIKGFKLNKDAVLNLTVPEEGLSIDGTIDLNGKSLTLMNDLTLSEGFIVFNAGTLTAKKNLYIGTKEQMEAGKTSSGGLSMRNEADVLNIDGDFVVCSRLESGLFAGTINLKGDLSQYGKADWGDDYNGKKTAINQCSTNVLVFCGNGLQSVYFDSSDSSVLSVEFANKNVELKSAIGGRISRDNMKWYWKVPEDGLAIDTQLALGGKTLTICGDLNLASGTVFLEEGTLNVQGDLNIGTKSGKTSSARLVMIFDEDTLNIDGDFINRCNHSAHRLDSGTINLKGNFVQYETAISGSTQTTGRFYATGTNRLVLSGTKKQSITFESESSFFNIVELTKSNANYNFKPKNCYKKIIYNTGVENIYIGDVGEYTYTGKAIIPDIKVYDNNTLLVKNIDYTMSIKNNIVIADADSAKAPTVTIKCKGNYSGTYIANFSIVACDISEAEDISLTVKDAMYTGKAIKPSIVLKNGQTTLQEKKDYTISCTNNIEAGTAKVTITGIGNYTGVITQEFRIIAKMASSLTITGEGNKALAAQTYTGLQLKPAIEVYNGKTLLTQGKDYTISYGENIKVGKGQITIEGIGIYAGKKTVSFNITALDISKEFITVDALADCTYNGAAQKPSVTIRYGNRILVENVDYKITYANNKNAAQSGAKNAPTVTITGRGNYKGTRKVTFNIGVYDFSTDMEMTVTAKDMMYTGRAVKAAVTVKKGTLTLKQNTDYTVTYSNNIEAGTGIVIITGKGNYTGTIKKEFRIIAKMASALTVKGEDDKALAAQTYTGSQLKPGIKVYNGKTLLTEGKDYTLTYGENIKVGKGQITIEGIGIYAGKKTVTFQIIALDINNARIKVNAVEDCIYNGTLQKPSVTVKYGNKVLVENVDYKITFSNNKNAALADSKKAPTVTITGRGNYKGTRKVTFNIMCGSLDASINEDILITVADMIYRNNECKPAVTVKDGSVTLKNKTDYVLSFVNNRALGEKNAANPPTVIITGKGNYAGSEVRIPFRIYEKEISSAKVATITKQKYTGAQIKPEIVVTYGSGKNLITLQEGKDYTVSYGENIKIGTGYVYIYGIGTYGGTKKVSFKIVK